MKEKIIPYILSASLLVNLILIYQVNTLPGAISDAINLPKKDTVIVTKTTTADLQHTSNFIFFQGTICSSSLKYSEHYSYKINLPSEIYEGYLTYVKSYIQQEVSGWFVTDDITTLGYMGMKKNI